MLNCGILSIECVSKENDDNDDDNDDNDDGDNVRDFKPMRPVIKKIDDSLSFVDGEKPRPKVITSTMLMMKTMVMMVMMAMVMMRVKHYNIQKPAWMDVNLDENSSEKMFLLKMRRGSSDEKNSEKMFLLKMRRGSSEARDAEEQLPWNQVLQNNSNHATCILINELYL